MNTRDCEHGRQVGKCADCDVIELEAENQQLRNQNTELDAACAMLEALNAELVEALREIVDVGYPTQKACMIAKAVLWKMEARK